MNEALFLGEKFGVKCRFPKRSSKSDVKIIFFVFEICLYLNRQNGENRFEKF